MSSVVILFSKTNFVFILLKLYTAPVPLTVSLNFVVPPSNNVVPDSAVLPSSASLSNVVLSLVSSFGAYTKSLSSLRLKCVPNLLLLTGLNCFMVWNCWNCSILITASSSGAVENVIILPLFDQPVVTSPFTVIPKVQLAKIS